MDPHGPCAYPLKRVKICAKQNMGTSTMDPQQRCLSHYLLITTAAGLKQSLISPTVQAL